MTFESFVDTVGVKVRAGLVASFGVEVGQDAAADAMAYAWEHWGRVQAMDNPAGYLFRVGQTAARRMRRPQRLFPAPSAELRSEIEPGLVPALQQLSEMQRACVVLVVGYGFAQAEVAEMLGVTSSTVRTHLDRGVHALRRSLEGVSEHC